MEDAALLWPDDADDADVADDSIPAAENACNLMAENRKCENY